MTIPVSSAFGREVHVESFLGRIVRDVDGRSAGRVEEICVEQHGTDYVIVEYHLGSAAIFERIMSFAGQLRALGLLERLGGKRRKASWDQLDLADPEHPRITVRADDLVEID
jgi:hypothetical protein